MKIKKFQSEVALKAFSKRNGMKFATAISVDDERAAEFVSHYQRQGLSVVELENFTLGRPAYLAFHK